MPGYCGENGLVKVEIVRVVDAARGLVRFRSAAGSASGFWKGSGPAVLGEVHVELDLPAEVSEWEVVPGLGFALEGGLREDAQASLTGEVLAVDDVVTLRVGGDVVLVEFSGPVPRVGQRVRVAAAEVHLYPYRL